MKFLIFIITFLAVGFSCENNSKQDGADKSQQPFDKIKWVMRSGDDYPYRDKMLEDLVANVTLKGLTYKELIDVLGAPDRKDSSYLFYRVAQQRIGFFPLHTKTLVIKFDRDSTVEWRKIHE